jgi:hypothetical protein
LRREVMGSGGEGLGKGESGVVLEEFGLEGGEVEEVFFFVVGVVATALKKREEERKKK